MTDQPAATGRLADQAQRDRATNALDTTFLVEAAAGTGKTTILVDRILSILRAGRASLREIAAITFTEKAAGELKVRLRQAVERELRDRPRQADAARSQALSDALADLEGMSVSTIHAFCADLIHERPVEARVEPGFVVADELRASLILEEAWETWLAEQMSGDSPAVRRAVESGISFEAAGARESPVFSLACELIEQRDAAAAGRVETPWTDAQFAAAAEALREPVAELAEARRRDCRRPETDGCARQIAELEAWISQTPKAEFDAIREWLADAPAIKAQAGQQGNWSSPAVLKTVKAGVGRAKDAVARLSGEADHRVLCDLAEWLRPFLDRYREAKERRRALDFTDLLLKARDMLRDSRAARDSFKRAFRCILVDEFQDTDPLQTEIVFFLSERPGEHAADWEAVNLVPGKLFIVGDPKQSIYRFRRADLDLYGRVRQAVARQGAMLQLSVNFRTVPWITGEVNRIFEPLMQGPAGDRFEPEHVPLVPQRSDEGTQPSVLVPLPPALPDGEALGVEDWRRKESGCIAVFIAELVGSGRLIRAGKPAVRRPVALRDIAVLYRSATGLDSLEEALRANDVPYQVSGGRYYYARVEFQDLLSALKAIDNPFDGLSVVGALRSPFFGQSDEDLLRHFGAGGTFNYLAGAPEGCRDLAEAFDALRDLHERRRRDPASAVLAHLFESTRALLIYANKPHGEQRVANLLKLQEIARAMAEAEVNSFSALVRRLSEMESSRQAEAESPIAEADENFVQVMTFHKAKGLEFPVVILAHLANEGESRENVLLDRARGRLHLNLNHRKTRGWDAAMADEADRAEYERRRMFYVALTRARDLLVIPAFWSRSPQAGFLKYLGERYAPSAGQKPAVEFVATDSFDLDKRSRDTLRLKPTPAPELPPEAVELAQHHEKWKETVQAEAEQLSAGRKIQTASGSILRNADFGMRIDDSDSRAGQSLTAQLEGRAAKLGSLVHQLMETVDFRAPGDLGPLAEAEARGLGLTPADAREAVGLVKRALAHPLIAGRAVKAEQLYREVPFAYMEGDTLYEGYADLVFIENGNAVIVDYKTDSVSEQEAAEHAKRYFPQAEIYMRAISAALGRAVKEFHFLFIRPGVAVPVSHAGKE
ncbi:MAG: UvrD-helicase domain-containing protein [Candidatus Brocadiia bacterium]|jgi:ATP-dependent exoDNAse (exonuclease V) beta subunit